MCLRASIASGVVLVLSVTGAQASSASAQRTKAPTPLETECDRECLRGLITQYLSALVAHNPRPLPVAPVVTFTEDGVEMKIGDGLWKSATTRVRPYRLDILDVREGVAAAHVVIEENGAPALLGLRLKVVDREIAEIETMVVRNQKEGIIFDIEKLQGPNKAMTIAPVRTQLNSREEMIAIAERYPAGLKAGSFVTSDVPFSADAYRFENGRLMAGPGCSFLPGCDQIKTQRIPTLSGVTYRVGAVDEEIGIVWLLQNFGPGSTGRREDVLEVWEAFKVYGGQMHAVEAFMESRPAGALSIWDTAEARRAAERVAPKAPGYVVRRTPWGDPDLNGIWPSIDMVRVPVQRAPQYGNRLFMTADEHAVLEKQEEERIVQMAREGAGGATGAPGHWVEWGKSQRQTSLIIDPPDGRMPPLTPEGRVRTLAAPRGTMGTAPLNSPGDFTMWERCISRGALGSTLPVLYNSGIDITQGPGFVAIRYEMVHDQRIIPLDSRPHLAPSMRQYMGDARGHWEDETLVVETTNFTDKVGVGLSGGGTPNSASMQLTERFTRVAPDTIRYEATVSDPRTWTAPWTVAFPLTRMPAYGMYEYACHEGNYGLRNALSASRSVEQPPAQRAPVAPALWTVTEGMNSPESVFFDSASGVVFVSQIGGQAADRDGNGRISKLTIDGKVIAADWVTGLNAPKGLRSFEGTLYAADLDEVVAIEIATGRVTSRVKIEGAQFLNDLATASDGTIYTSDSFGNRIYIIKAGNVSTFFEGESILLPNGVLVDGDRLVVASDGRPARGGGGTPAKLVAIDIRTKAVSEIAKAPVGTPDGVEHDGQGGFLVSDVGAGRILQVTSSGEVRVLRQLDPQTADIAFVPEKGLLLVPHLGLNRVSAYELSELK